MALRLGTCGYSYREWRGVFYPEKLAPGRFLEYYAGEFDAVELNATYYRLPDPRSLAGMARRTPPGFLFVVKAHQALTHVYGEEARKMLPLFKAALEPFADAGKLGGVLLQFPFSFRPSPEAKQYLAGIASALDGVPVVVEFRHRAWFGEPTFEWLRGLRISLCSVDEPDLPNLPPRASTVTGPLAYVRFHGRNRQAWWGSGEARGAGARYDYLYSRQELEEWLPRIRGMEGQSSTLFAFFNNHPKGQAVINARDLREMLGGGG